MGDDEQAGERWTSKGDGRRYTANGGGRLGGGSGVGDGVAVESLYSFLGMAALRRCFFSDEDRDVDGFSSPPLGREGTRLIFVFFVDDDEAAAGMGNFEASGIGGALEAGRRAPVDGAPVDSGAGVAERDSLLPKVLGGSALTSTGSLLGDMAALTRAACAASDTFSLASLAFFSGEPPSREKSIGAAMCAS